MRVFHGSLEVVRCPEIRKSDRPLDYGDGFYVTTSYQQAESWVKRKIKEKDAQSGYVNVYEYDEDGSKALKRLVFPSATDEWIDFVMANRMQKGYTHKNDIVFGPVANDRVYASFALYEGDIIDKEELKKRLKTYKLVDQFLFHSVDALRFLTYVESKEVTL